MPFSAPLSLWSAPPICSLWSQDGPRFWNGCAYTTVPRKAKHPWKVPREVVSLQPLIVLTPEPNSVHAVETLAFCHYLLRKGIFKPQKFYPQRPRRKRQVKLIQRRRSNANGPVVRAEAWYITRMSYHFRRQFTSGANAALTHGFMITGLQ
jgi:hypothetical protein